MSEQDQSENEAALSAFLKLPPAERAQILAQFDEQRRANLSEMTDWSPLGAAAVHHAWQAATACIAARYYGTAVAFSELIDGYRPEHVIWCLAELAASQLRAADPAAAKAVIERWGAMAAEGVQGNDHSTDPTS